MKIGTAAAGALRSDALVCFGASGDLAYKQIFPALQAMVRRGALDVPVIGVARSGDRRTPLHLYEAGTWGPAEADRLIAPRSWHKPVEPAAATRAGSKR
jgi:glucose-6-phosphate 1-dehydrogenase